MTNDLWVLVKVVRHNNQAQTSVTICEGEGAAADRLVRAKLLVDAPTGALRGCIPTELGFAVAEHLANMLGATMRLVEQGVI